MIPFIKSIKWENIQGGEYFLSALYLFNKCDFQGLKSAQYFSDSLLSYNSGIIKTKSYDRQT